MASPHSRASHIRSPSRLLPRADALQFPSGESQIFLSGLPSHSLCSHLFGYHPPVVQAVSLQLVVVPDCHMASEPPSLKPFMFSLPGSSCEACLLARLQAGSFISPLTSLPAPGSAQPVMRRSEAPRGDGRYPLHAAHPPRGVGTLPTAQGVSRALLLQHAGEITAVKIFSSFFSQ